jgi:hypothetical protein
VTNHPDTYAEQQTAGLRLVPLNSWCPGPELNRYVSFETRDFKSRASASFATRAAGKSLKPIYQFAACGLLVLRSKVIHATVTLAVCFSLM